MTVDYAVLERVERRLATLERRYANLTAYALGRYKRGYAVGVMAERRRQVGKAADWDAWGQEMDIGERKRHFHRLAGACEGAGE